MNQVALALDLKQFVNTTLTNVFSTMLSLDLQAASDGQCSPGTPRVSGCVGLAGEKITGAVYLHFSESFARQVVSAMLGLGLDEIENGSVNDVVGEVCNMVAGGLKSELCDIGAPCAVTTPAVIRGAAFRVEAMPHIRRELFFFACQEECIIAEVHLKMD